MLEYYNSVDYTYFTSMSSLQNFNTNLEQFLNIIIENYPEQKTNIEEYYTFPLEGLQYLEMFYSNCRDKGDYISSKNEIIFSKDTTLLENVDFYEIWNDEKVDTADRNNIWKYLHTLFLYSFETKQEKDLSTIVNELRALTQSKTGASGEEESALDEHAQTFLTIIENLSQEMQNINKTSNSNAPMTEEAMSQNIDEILNATEDKDTSSSAANFASALPGMGKMFGNLKMDELFNGTIGNIAQEVIQEIDMSKMDIGDPSQLLGNLLSGKIDENNGLMNMVKNITSKIQSKVSANNVNEEDLVKEAESMMGNLKSFTENPMFKSMFESMKSAGLGGGPIPKNAKPQVNQNKLRLASTRDRLRRKLEAKRQALQKIQQERLGE